MTTPVSIQVVSAACVVVFITSTLALAVKLKLASGEETEIIKTKDVSMPALQVFGLELLLFIVLKLLDFEDPASLVSKPYLAMVGVHCIAEALNSLVSNLHFTNSPRVYTYDMKVPLYGVYKLELTATWMFAFVLAASFTVAWLLTKLYVLDSAFLIVLVAKGTMVVAAGSLKSGVLLTCNLLACYRDTDTALAILFPSSILSLSLRYDSHRANVIGSVATFPSSSFSVNVLVYCLGLVGTMTAMFLLDAAQSTLENVGPVCLGLVLHYVITGPAISSNTSVDADDKADSSVQCAESSEPTRAARVR